MFDGEVSELRDDRYRCLLSESVARMNEIGIEQTNPKIHISKPHRRNNSCLTIQFD